MLERLNCAQPGLIGAHFETLPHRKMLDICHKSSKTPLRRHPVHPSDSQHPAL
jgi:hypothetical protein